MPEVKRWTSPETIDREFDHQPPRTPAVAAAHQRVRELLKAAAHELNDLLPECPMKTDAKNALRTAMWAANSAIACHGNHDPAWLQVAADRFGNAPRWSPPVPDPILWDKPAEEADTREPKGDALQSD